MRKKLKILMFSKMAPTILIKFVGLQYIRIPTTWHYRLFLEKSLKLEIQFLIFCSSPNVAPKPNDQSRSNSISRIPLQISLPCFFFIFDIPSKVRVVHIRKKFKIFNFSNMAPTISIKLCGFIAYSNLNNMTLSVFSGKMLVTRIIFF